MDREIALLWASIFEKPRCDPNTKKIMPAHPEDLLKAAVFRSMAEEQS